MKMFLLCYKCIKEREEDRHGVVFFIDNPLAATFYRKSGV